MTRSPLFPYTTTIKTLPLGCPEQFFRVFQLEDLDRTIDLVFDHLKKTGQEAWLDRHCPYFGVVWPSALALCSRLTPQPGARILELGCGLALPSLLGAKLGFETIATDAHVDVPYFLERNRALNLSAAENARFHYAALDWTQTDALDAFAAARGPFECVIGSDVLYESSHPEKVVHTLARLKPHQAWITDPGRSYLQRFVDLARDAGFRIKTDIVRIDEAQPLVPFSNRDIFVLELTQ